MIGLRPGSRDPGLFEIISFDNVLSFRGGAVSDDLLAESCVPGVGCMGPRLIDGPGPRLCRACIMGSLRPET